MRNLIDRALQISSDHVRAERSDFDLNPAFPKHDADKLRKAAVLVPIVDHADSTSLLLTKRTEHLKSHPGQVSFPGGKIDDTDTDAVAAALRETHEEIGLHGDYIDIRGFLAPYQTSTGYLVTPVVGIVEPGFSLTLEEGEVESAFEVPLSFLRNRRNHQKHFREWQGKRRYYYAMPYGDYYIWGATAGMIVNLCDHLDLAEKGALVS